MEIRNSYLENLKKRRSLEGHYSDSLAPEGMLSYLLRGPPRSNFRSLYKFGSCCELCYVGLIQLSFELCVSVDKNFWKINLKLLEWVDKIVWISVWLFDLVDSLEDQFETLCFSWQDSLKDQFETFWNGWQDCLNISLKLFDSVDKILWNISLEPFWLSWQDCLNISLKLFDLVDKILRNINLKLFEWVGKIVLNW